MTPIELARKHGAEIDYSGIKGSDPANIAYEFDAQELDAYSRALVAPYVEALKLADDALNSCGLLFGEKSYNTKKVEQAKEALAAHREMFGGE